jgi:diadenosine tetraphosphate (Ap4A) HIT family hydrolase
MSLTKEEIEEIRKQLLNQIHHLPEDQKIEAQEKILSMSPEVLESFLKEQQAMQMSDKPKNEIFRMIVDKEIPSKIIDENKDSIAVLDIKPISIAHVVIIPKKRVVDAKQMPSSTFRLAKSIAKRISLKLKAKGFEIQTEFKFGEVILNLIPIYDKSLNLNSPRTEQSEEELNKIYNLIRRIKKEKIIRIKRPQNSQNSSLRINRRVP